VNRWSEYAGAEYAGAEDEQGFIEES